MATFVLTNAKLWVAGYDLSGDHNRVGLTYAAELLDATVFGDATRKRVGGLKVVTLEHGGFWNDADDGVDEQYWSRLGLSDEVMTLSPDGGAEGALAYTFKSVLGEYAPGGQLGELLAFTVRGEGRDVLVRGTVMVNGTKTTTGASTSRQLGSVGSSQRVYASLHVLAVSGTNPTLDVTVRSDDNQGMTSPTTRITFPQETAIGAAWGAPAAGPISDSWWEVAWTLGGTNPSFTFVVVVGIQ